VPWAFVLSNKEPTAKRICRGYPLDVEGQQKAPDYTFRVGLLPKFYAEAKRCGVNISADPGPAYQLRRYGWSGKLELSILTDFEEFPFYDAWVKAYVVSTFRWPSFRLYFSRC
jgi:hypothetical protein